jgi:hypothetical protein
MTQALYAHINNKTIKKKEVCPLNVPAGYIMDGIPLRMLE